MPETTAVAPLLTRALAVLMLIQALTGLLVQGQYRDVEWNKATWFGNDWVTLVVAVPRAGLICAAAGSTRGLLLRLGLIRYAVYNYAFYLGRRRGRPQKDASCVTHTDERLTRSRIER